MTQSNIDDFNIHDLDVNVKLDLNVYRHTTDSLKSMENLLH